MFCFVNGGYSIRVIFFLFRNGLESLALIAIYDESPYLKDYQSVDCGY